MMLHQAQNNIDKKSIHQCQNKCIRYLHVEVKLKRVCFLLLIFPYCIYYSADKRTAFWVSQTSLGATILCGVRSYRVYTHIHYLKSCEMHLVI